jgi:hypothetical protein
MKKVYLLSALIVIQLATCSYRDKLGTTFFGFSGSRHEVALNKAFCIRQKYKAERAGFEPAVRCYSYADLANRCFRPLSHLSGTINLLEFRANRKKLAQKNIQLFDKKLPVFSILRIFLQICIHLV